MDRAVHEAEVTSSRVVGLGAHGDVLVVGVVRGVFGVPATWVGDVRAVVVDGRRGDQKRDTIPVGPAAASQGGLMVQPAVLEGQGFAEQDGVGGAVGAILDAEPTRRRTIHAPKHSWKAKGAKAVVRPITISLTVSQTVISPVTQRGLALVGVTRL